MWQFMKPGQNRSWNADRSKIIGVETGVYRSGKVVKGTRWGEVNGLIETEFPQVQKPMELHKKMRIPIIDGCRQTANRKRQ